MSQMKKLPVSEEAPPTEENEPPPNVVSQQLLSSIIQSILKETLPKDITRRAQLLIQKDVEICVHINVKYKFLCKTLKCKMWEYMPLHFYF